MPTSLRIARIDVSGLRLLTDDFASLKRDHTELQRVIRRHLSRVTASLLAVPEPCADGKHVDWYTDLSGQPVPLKSLPPAKRTQIRARLQDRLSSIRKLADELPKRSRGAEQVARLLRAATHYPDEGFVYAVGDEPVLILWGFVRAGGKSTGRLGTAAAAEAAARRARRLRRGVTWGSTILLLGLAAGLGGWYWVERQREQALYAELDAVLAAECRDADAADGLEERLAELDPRGEQYAAIRERLAGEQALCAAAIRLRADIEAAGWDCPRLEALRRDLAGQETGRQPFGALSQRLDATLAVCSAAARYKAALAGALGDCDKIALLDQDLGRPPADAQPLAEVRAAVDAEVALCAEAGRLGEALAAHAGDCDHLYRMDGQLRSLDTARRPLAPLKAKLDEGLALCKRAAGYRQDLVEAQMDCVRLEALAEKLRAEDVRREPLKSIREGLDTALEPCKALKELDKKAPGPKGP